MLQSLIDYSQKYVEGEVTLKLYKGSVKAVARKSNLGPPIQKSKSHLKMIMGFIIKVMQQVLLI